MADSRNSGAVTSSGPASRGTALPQRPATTSNAIERDELTRHPRTAEERESRIATAAYWIAERRGFTPGLELDDWLEAEREVDAAR
jgi:hypothetical protein